MLDGKMIIQNLKSLIEISIDGFFSCCSKYDASCFCYFTSIYIWLNQREICFLCNCDHVCKEYSCCSFYKNLVDHCPTCLYKKCKYCRRLERFNKLYANLALNRTFLFRKYLLDINDLVTKYSRYFMTFEYERRTICNHTYLFDDNDTCPPWNRKYVSPSTVVIKNHSSSCSKSVFNFDKMTQMYIQMFGHKNIRDYNSYNHVNYKQIPLFLNLFCSIRRTTDSMTLMDYFMFILPFRYHNLTFFVNIPWNLV